MLGRMAVSDFVSEISKKNVQIVSYRVTEDVRRLLCDNLKSGSCNYVCKMYFYEGRRFLVRIEKTLAISMNSHRRDFTRHQLS